jgi:hypothetical protein
MKTLEEIKTKDYVVQITEDTYENKGNPLFLKCISFQDIEEARKAFHTACELVRSLETDPEYKEIELYERDADGNYTELIAHLFYKVEYPIEDYGKFLLTYSNTNNEPNFIRIEVIDQSTKFYASSKDRYGIKYAVFDINEECAMYIYLQSLHVSEIDAKQMFNDLVNDERYNIEIPND